MGKRIVILNKKDLMKNGEINPNQIGVYLNVNGGRRHVEGFLKYCELQDFRRPDWDYHGWACLCTVIGNFYGDGLSVGIDTAEHLDYNNWQNDIYLIEGWEIVDRKCFADDVFKEDDNEELRDFLIEINKKMPEHMQLDLSEIDRVKGEKYIVTIEEVIGQDFEIIAEDGGAAMEIAEEQYKKGILVLDSGEVHYRQMAITKPDIESTNWCMF